MSDDGTCDICGRPLSTQRDADEIAPGHGEEWCWRQWHGGVCLGEPVDWRQRFLAEAEARVAAEGACDCAEAEVARLREQAAEEHAAWAGVTEQWDYALRRSEKLMAEVAALRARLSEERATSALLRGLLGECEWKGKHCFLHWPYDIEERPACPICGRAKDDGHAPSCRLAAALEKDHG